MQKRKMQWDIKGNSVEILTITKITGIIYSEMSYKCVWGDGNEKSETG